MRKDPRDTPAPRLPSDDPSVIDYAFGRSRELVETKAGDNGEGHLIFADNEVTFLTERGRYWKLPYDGIDSFQLRRGFLGYLAPWLMRILEFKSGSKVFHSTIDKVAAQNALYILTSKGISRAR
jgi:hypothetical protein